MRHHGSLLRELVADLTMYPQKMVNVPWQQGRDWTECKALVTAKAELEAELGSRGRVLIRPSGTEPKLRLMVEAQDLALVDAGIERLLAIDLG